MDINYDFGQHAKDWWDESNPASKLLFQMSPKLQFLFSFLTPVEGPQSVAAARYLPTPWISPILPRFSPSEPDELSFGTTILYENSMHGGPKLNSGKNRASSAKIACKMGEIQGVGRQGGPGYAISPI